ncbi:Ig-like domain-containing protein [Parabacteroides sp. PF5-6]|uniref:Ig-like domain-containing protein n=1 Tax=Parabacteroides sp. PF5-6 TaxID=1742403 RepID=UPI002404F310|nr:Ig-like domain-containing protein [Parabacteroides sp. PF5-6]MDF9830195.1 hypothetical protein [Parabacteroides sp. PF5-6]
MKQIVQLTMVILALASGINLYAVGDNTSTGTLYIGENDYDLSVDQEKTGEPGWKWTAKTSTLALDTGYVAKAIYINCANKDSITLVYTANITIESTGTTPLRCDGALTIQGKNNRKLTLIYTGDDEKKHALYSQRILTIEDGRLDLQTSNSSKVENGLFTAKAAALYAAEGLAATGKTKINANVTGENAFGILLTRDKCTSIIDLEDEGTITANSTGAGGALWIDNGHTLEIKGGNLFLSNNAATNPIKGSGNYVMVGGTLQYNNGPAPVMADRAPVKEEVVLGDVVTLHGVNLSDTAKVWIGGKEAIVLDGSNQTKLDIQIPAGEAGDIVDVLIETYGGRTFLQNAFKYTASSYRITLNLPVEAELEGNRFIDVASGTTIDDLLPTPTQEACLFRGWSTDQIRFEKWENATEVTEDWALHGVFIKKAILTPDIDAKGVAVNTPITIVFPTNPVKIAGATITADLSPYEGTLTCKYDTLTYSNKPIEYIVTIEHEGLKHNTEYTVTLFSEAFSAYPEDITWTFTTADLQSTVFHTISLIVGEGIDCSYSTGTLTISEDDHLFLTFYAENPELTATDIVLLIDGVETAFNASVDGRGGNYILNSIEKDCYVEIRLREGAVDPDPDPDTTGNLDHSSGNIQIAIINYQLSIINSGPAVDVMIYSITGKNVVSLRGLRGSKTFALPTGIYIVRAGGQTWKLMING